MSVKVYFHLILNAILRGHLFDLFRHLFRILPKAPAIREITSWPTESVLCVAPFSDSAIHCSITEISTHLGQLATPAEIACPSLMTELPLVEKILKLL